MATFEELYHQHVQSVFRFALSVAGRRELAEDLTSEAFLALHRNLESIDQAQLPGWLLTVVRDRGPTFVEGLEHDEPVLDPQAERRLYARIDGTLAQQRDSDGFKVWFRYALITPAIAVGVLAVWFVVYRPDRTISQPFATPPPVAAAPPVGAPPLLLAFNKPDVRLSAAALTGRGATSDNQLLADLKPALDAYRQNDYETANRLLTTLSSRYPSVVEVHFYQGISRLFLNDASAAINSFAAAEKVADDTFIADVMWYRAVAEQRAGNGEDARARIESLCHGSRSPERACTALEQLNAAPGRE